MTAELKSLPNNGMAPSNADIARHLREFADWLEEPDAKPLRNAILVLEPMDGHVYHSTCGLPQDLARCVGILFAAMQDCYS